MKQQGNMNAGITDSANGTILNDARTHDSVRKRSFSEASTVISPDALPDMSSISLSDNSSTNNTSPALAAGEAPIVTDAESAVADKPKLPLSRAAIIAKAQAAKNGRVFIAPSAAAKRSARLKTSNYKPILAAGKGSLAHLEQSRKEAAEKKAKEEEETRALKKEKEKEGKMRRFLDQQVKQLMQRLPDEAVMDLPDDFYKLTADTKLKILVDAHLEYRKRGLNRVRGDMAERTEESGRILGEIEQLEELQDFEGAMEHSEEHTECICDECQESQGGMV